MFGVNWLRSSLLRISLLLLLPLLKVPTVDCLGVSWDWSKWWTYDGISGPNFWGLINPEWSLCTQGRRQSPLNMDPTLLLFDPNLRPLHLDKQRVGGTVNNTGHSVVFTLDVESAEQQRSGRFQGSSSMMKRYTGEEENEIKRRRAGEESYENGYKRSGRYYQKSNRSNKVPREYRYRPNSMRRDNVQDSGGLLGGISVDPGLHKTDWSPTTINITGGPLSYKYQVTHLQIHFGSMDQKGSEHTVNGSHYPAEIQIYGFNSQLFKNYSEAATKSHGIVVIAVMVQLGSENLNPELQLLTTAIEKIRYSGSTTRISSLSLRGLLPTTEHYLTYEGSLTHPPCYETVTWLIVNKPIYMSRDQMDTLRVLNQGTAKTPKALMGNNYRPVQSLHHRALRTNVDFSKFEGDQSRTRGCHSMVGRMHYTANVLS